MNDGGAAFPFVINPMTGAKGETGMSLRDYFAGQALIGLLSSSVWVKGLDRHLAKELQQGEFKRFVAAHSYLMADEMLKARGEQS